MTNHSRMDRVTNGPAEQIPPWTSVREHGDRYGGKDPGLRNCDLKMKQLHCVSNLFWTQFWSMALPVVLLLRVSNMDVLSNIFDIIIYFSYQADDVLTCMALLA